MKDYHRILELPKTATAEEIRAQYKRLVRIYHPDRFTKSQDRQYVEEKLREINEAYDVLLGRSASSVAADNATVDSPLDDVENSQETYSAPQPVITPAILEFGELKKGERKALLFQLRNTGGIVHKFQLDYSDGSWFSVNTGRRLHKQQPFPMEFSVVVDAGRLAIDTYRGWIQVSMDTVNVHIPVHAEIIRAKPLSFITSRLAVALSMLIIVILLLLFQFPDLTHPIFSLGINTENREPAIVQSNPTAQAVAVTSDSSSEDDGEIDSQSITQSTYLSITTVSSSSHRLGVVATENMPPTSTIVSRTGLDLTNSKIVSTALTSTVTSTLVTSTLVASTSGTQSVSSVSHTMPLETVPTQTIPAKLSGTVMPVSATRDRVSISSGINTEEANEPSTPSIAIDQANSEPAVTSTSYGSAADRMNSTKMPTIATEPMDFPTVTKTSVATITPSATQSPTATPTLTPSTTATSTRSATATSTSSPTGTSTVSPTEIPAFATLLPMPTQTPVLPTPTPSSTWTSVPSPTPSITAVKFTPVAEFTATPTPFPTSSGNTAVIVIPDSYNVNARADTSVNATVLQVLVSGTQWTAIGKTIDDSWLYIRLENGQRAWVYTDSVLVDPITISSLPIEVPASFQ